MNKEQKNWCTARPWFDYSVESSFDQDLTGFVVFTVCGKRFEDFNKLKQWLEQPSSDTWLTDYVKNRYVEAIMGIFGVSRLVATMYLERRAYSLDKTVEDLREQTENDH